MIEDLRLCIYESLARTGRMPDPAALRAIAGDQVLEALHALAA